MDKNKPQTSKTNGAFVKTEKDDDDEDRRSNNTEPYNYNQFRSSILTEKYSVHQNDAALEEDFRRILAGDSDNDLSGPPEKSCSTYENGTNVSSLDKSPSKRRSMLSKDDYVLSWAESVRTQSISLSMVASVLTDHDYLSQENTLGIMNSNEEAATNERQLQKGKDEAENVDGGEPSVADDMPTDEIVDLNSVVKLLIGAKTRKECLSLLTKIQDKTKLMKCHLGEMSSDDEQKDSNSEFNMPPNYSEPLEYYGNSNFPSETTTDHSDQSGDECQRVRNSLKMVVNVNRRINTDLKTIREKLSEIELIKEVNERHKNAKTLEANVELMINGMADELKSIASSFKSKDETEIAKIDDLLLKASTSKQQDPNAASKSQSKERPTYDSDSDGSVRSSNAQKKLRRRRKHRSNDNIFTSDSSDISTTLSDRQIAIKNEPTVHSQAIEDLMNGQSNDYVRAPSAASSKDADNDDELMGFAEGSSEIEIGIKTELLQTLESEPMIIGMQSESGTFNGSAKENENRNGSIDVTKECDNLPIDKSAIVNANTNKDKKSSNIDDDMGSNKDELLSLAENGLSASDEDDADIRKLCDFSSLGIRRQMPTSTKEKPNIVAEPVKKPTTKPPKEDELMKIMNKPDDIEQSPPMESDEHSEQEEITEEQFLRERNEFLKEQLLEDSSGEDSFVESESDVENVDSSNLNGNTESNYDSDDFEEDDKETSESDGSLMDKFLGVDEKPKTKEIQLGGETNKRAAPIPSVSAIENGSDSDCDSGASDKPKKKKSKTAIGAKIFANIEKDDEIELSSDDDDVKLKSKAHDNDKKSATGDMLDTSMFKSQKRDIDPNRLSKKLLEDRAKKSSATSNDRVSPEEPIMLSSDEDDLEQISTGKNDEEDKGKRGPRKLLRDDQLADDTKQAQRDEQERIKRLEKKNSRLSQYLESQRILSQESQDDIELINENELILDYDSKKKEKIIVHPDITKHLKKHQYDGIKFMYDCCYGSVDNLEKFPGSGCILAHCMGLGKTLQLISLLNTVISYPQLKTDRILVICPKSTVMNWKEEIERWVNPIHGKRRRLKLFTFAEQSEINQKLSRLKEWYQCGESKLNPQAGVFLLGYEAFRVLVNYHDSKKGVCKYSAEDRDKIRDSVNKYLLKPGADLVVCDEGHIIKNQKSTTSLAVNRICTKRRIVLTGTPIQNNLKEYYAMVNFIKPSFLGTEKEFANLYATPIKNGQHKDSSKAEIKYMKQRSYVLHKKLSKFVQRREAALLKSFLPKKYEYVVFIPITKAQATLYQFFLDNNPNKVIMGGKSLIPDYTVLRKIWTHPKVLESAYKNAIAKNKPMPVINGNDSGDEPDDVLDTQTGLMSVTNNWWKNLLDANDLNTILPSYKLHVLFEILSKCREYGEKCLIFSAFVAVLDVVEFFMQEICKQDKDKKIPGLETFVGPWEYGRDYYRLDGKTPKNRRHEMITSFNKPENKRTTAFLISAKAGGQGINLIGANRVILLDTSWNPSNDQQNIFRVFRLGQKKVCYIYRLLAMGTMEEKVYSRSVTKQAMSCRVVDEQQIDRHYNMAELTELYTLTIPKMEEREMPNYPQDSLLAHLLRNYPHMVYKYHEHDSLLENKNEQDLSEEEKAEAWKQYDDDVKRKNETNMGPYGNNIGMLPNYSNLGSYASSFYNNYSSLSGISGLNYPYNPYSQYSSFGNDYNPLRFNDYAAFYNKLMNSPLNYNQSTSPNLLSPNHPTPGSSPSPHMNNFSSARNWMQSSASAASSPYGNSLLSSLAQTSPTHINSIMNNFYNTLGNGNTSNFSSLLPSTSGNQTGGADATHDFGDISALASYLQQQQQLSSMAGTSGTTSPSISTSNTAQGPNAMRNPILTKELSITNRNPILDKYSNLLSSSSIQTSVITKSTTTTSVVTSQSPITVTTVSAGSPSTAAVNILTNKSKSSEANISSTNDKNGASKLMIKEVNSIAQKSPDTSASKTLKKSIENANGSPVTSTVIDKGKQMTSIQKPPNSTNMGIVYPASKSLAKSSVSISDRNQWLKVVNVPTTTKTESETTANKTTTTTAQPQANIIRRSNFTGVPTSPGIASRNAVNTLTNNREITVTQTRGALPPVSNSITVSPITITDSVAKKPHITNSPAQVVLSKVNNLVPSSRTPISAVPVALMKAPQPLVSTTNSVNRVPTKQTVSPLRTNNPPQVSQSAKTLVSTTTIPRINGNPKIQMPAPRIVQGTTPVIAKVQSLSVPSGTNNKSQSPTQQMTKIVPSVATGKRPQSSMASNLPMKKSKMTLGPSSTPSTSRGNQPPKLGVLQGLRMSSRPPSNQKTNSQISPIEIVELD